MTTVLLLLVLAQGGMPQTAETSSELAAIGGRVTDRDTGAPIPRAVVRLSKIPDGESSVAMADENGQWQLLGLVSGQYMGYVEAGLFRATHLGEPIGPAGTQRAPIVLKPGEKRKDLNITLRRSLAIGVRVIDEWGEPVSGMTLSANSIQTGFRAILGMPQTTDDRGQLRLSGLIPGTYVVCAEPWPPSSGGGSQLQLLRTCYPSTTDDTSAEQVRVDRADVEGIEIQMRRGRTWWFNPGAVSSQLSARSSLRCELKAES